MTIEPLVVPGQQPRSDANAGLPPLLLTALHELEHRRYVLCSLERQLLNLTPSKGPRSRGFITVEDFLRRRQLFMECIATAKVSVRSKAEHVERIRKHYEAEEQ